MKQIDKGNHYELHPESAEDVEILRKQYPDCFPCNYVCVNKPAVSGHMHRDAFFPWHRPHNK